MDENWNALKPMESIPGNVYKTMDYYPFGVLMQGRNFNSVIYSFGYQGSVKDNELKNLGNSYTTEFRELDPRLGQWLSIDPEAKDASYESPYISMSDNPVWYNDVRGDKIVDKKGNEVKVTRDDNGSLHYEFNKDYSAKQKARMEKWFNKYTAPLLEDLTKSTYGNALIDDMISMPTNIKIKINQNRTPNGANSFVHYEKNGVYSKNAKITPFYAKYDPTTGNFADFPEWIGAVMTIEVGHLNPDQRALERGGYSRNPKNPNFAKSYQGLINGATVFRIMYRLENGIPLNNKVFSALDAYAPYGVTYGAFALEFQKLISNGTKIQFQK